jgi:hypothetical protein
LRHAFKKGAFNKGHKQQNKAKRKQREREFGLVAREICTEKFFRPHVRNNAPNMRAKFGN